MAVYKNLIQLQQAMNLKLSIVLDNTLDILLKELQRLIEEEVYGWHSNANNPWEIHRTHQFYDSWEKTKLVAIGNMVQGEIGQSFDVMKQFFIGDVEVHEDRETLADIIMSGEGYNFGNAPKRDFWTPFIVYVNQQIEDIIYKECLKVGLSLERVSIL